MADTIDQQFVEYIVKSLVGNPDEVKIVRRIDEKGVLLELTVAQEDLGRVIGKRGATAQSLRTLLRALGTKQDARYNLKIVDPNGGNSGGHSDYSNSRDDHQGSASNDDNPISSDETEDRQEDEEVAEVEAAVAEEKPEEDTSNDRISQTRKELADLDDLDV